LQLTFFPPEASILANRTSTFLSFHKKANGRSQEPSRTQAPMSQQQRTQENALELQVTISNP